jgi:Tol biopolymer transport system component
MIKQLGFALGAAVAGVLATSSAASAAPKSVTLDKPVAYVRSGVIYLSKGATETRLTEDAVNGRPRFSPDGRRIAYLHNGTVWVMNADGSGKRQVSDRIGGGPAWSPDGAYLAFAGYSCTGGPGVYRVSSTKTAPSPEVLFPASCREQEIPQVAAIMATPAASGTRTLAEKLREDDAVAWSPDGTKIAFRGGNCEDIADACLSVGNVATGGEIAIDVYGGGGNETKGFGVIPAWRADGKRLAWTAYTADAKPVHVEEADPTGANRRTIGVAEDRELVYQGAGKGVLTATYQGRSTITIVDLASGKRTPFKTGSQPTVQP